MLDTASAESLEAAARDHAPMLRARLRPPIVPEHFLQRRRLLDHLDETVTRALTIVDSPAGSGKTMLLASWVSTARCECAWLTLDQIDTDESQLWYDLVAALETVRPACGTEATDALSTGAPMRHVATALLERLEDQPGEPCVLVIDDFDVVADASETLCLFFQHLPQWLHIVVLSRRTPHLPLDRLRGRGQLVEIRFNELRLSLAETRELLNHIAPTLDEGEVEEIAVDSEGWAIGVQLAALAARSAKSQSESESTASDSIALIEDYTWHEVLATTDVDTLQVLLDISVVDHVNDSLARALSARSNASELLLRAESDGLFVTRLGPDRGFRVHSLVRKVLLDELSRRGRRREQHALAARWYEDNEQTTDALEQWLLADQPREALRLVAQRSAALYDSGHEATIRRTIAAIPYSVTCGDVSATLDYAFSHVLVDRRTFVEMVEQATWLADRSPISETTRAQLTLLQAVSASIRGDWTTGRASSLQVLSGMERVGRLDRFGLFGWNTVARGVALNEEWSEDCDDVRSASLATSRDPARGLSLEGIRAVGHAVSGHPVEALQVVAGVAHAASSMSILATELALAEALAHRELGDRERALIELGGIADASLEPTLYCQVLAMVTLAGMHADEGSIDAAERELRRAETLVIGEGIGSGIRTWFAVVGTVIALANEDPREARRWADSTTDSFWAWISLARIHLAEGDRAAAAEALGRAVPRCVRHQVIHGILDARCSADADHALAGIGDVLQLASTHGVLQTVASECRDCMELVELASWRAPAHWMDRLRRAAAIAATEERDGPNLIEPLTNRERDVLRLLPSRLTLREIAKELYVSTNTLKFHLRVIYRKLGVNSRAEAAVFARSMTAVRTTNGASADRQ